MGVDWWKNKHQPVVPILRIDMTSQQGQRLIWRILEQCRVKVVHFAPPCGTMSRAREIPLPQWIKDKAIPEPYPLRPERCPQGLPGLEGTDLVKVQKANILAAFACDIAVWCLSHGDSSASRIRRAHTYGCCRDSRSSPRRGEWYE